MGSNTQSIQLEANHLSINSIRRSEDEVLARAGGDRGLKQTGRAREVRFDELKRVLNRGIRLPHDLIFVPPNAFSNQNQEPKT